MLKKYKNKLGQAFPLELHDGKKRFVHNLVKGINLVEEEVAKKYSYIFEPIEEVVEEETTNEAETENVIVETLETVEEVVEMEKEDNLEPVEEVDYPENVQFDDEVKEVTEEQPKKRGRQPKGK